MSDDFDPATAVLVTLGELRGVPLGRWTEGSDFDLAMRLDRVVALQGVLEEARAEVETALAERMEGDEMPVAGVGVLKRVEQTGSSWKFPHSGEMMREDLANAVAANVALDVATGELDQAKRNVALAAIRTAYEAIPSFSTLKVAGRERLGLRISDYREYSTHYRVQVVTE